MSEHFYFNPMHTHAAKCDDGEVKFYTDENGEFQVSFGYHPVLVCVGGRWHMICYSENFNDESVTTVCRQFGYATGLI